MIIFDGEDICVHFNQGNTNFLVITLIGIGYEAAWQHQYFAKPIVEKQNISCLGIVSKKRNWYVTNEMHHVFAIIQEMKNTFKKIITIGASAGGYAALKYSVYLQSDVTIAMAPQLSIDSDEWPTEPEWAKLCTSDMKGMSIKKEDIKGKVLILYDKQHVIDSKTAEYIYNFNNINFSQIYIFSVPYAGHIIYESIKGTELINLMLNYSLNEHFREDNFYKQLSVIRRKNYVNLYNRLMVGRNKHPLLCYYILVSPKFIQIKNFIRILHDEKNIFQIIAKLSERGYFREAARLFSILCFYYASLEYDVKYNINNRQNYILCFDHLGGILSYSLEGKKLKSAHPVLNKEDVYMVYLITLNGKFYPYINLLGKQFFLKKDGDDIRIIQNIDDSDVLMAQVSANKVCVTYKDSLMSLLPTNEVCWDAKECLSFETFWAIYI